MIRKNPENVLVTGGGGFLGKAIIRLLLKRGDHVTSFSRKHHKNIASLKVEQVLGDLKDYEKVKAACKGMDIVFHAAAKPGVWGAYKDYFETNVKGTENIISSCISNKVQRLVYTGSPSVVFDGGDMEGIDESAPYPEKLQTPYQKTKAIAEQKVVKVSNKIRTITLRPHLIWGPGDNHLVPRIIARANRMFIVGKGKNLVDTVYVDNAATAHILAADRLAEKKDLSGKIYFISQDEPVCLWDIINEILKAAGLAPVTRSVSHKTAWIAGALLELVYKAFRIRGEPQMTRFVADELATAHWFDISAAKKDLGYFPEISTKEGLERLKEWLHNFRFEKL